ncbi:type II toxin-antitoxin system PemK/MazF family toxin [Sphingomonas sp. TF3]|uniref:type II toxin-antitoxin system PemK/MazF family toxin n=1 Tax=unclassified Sphingomonas TaxID=196159 RepID=UPI001C8EEC2F|nr:type II toxin-antitoxin system PemK/MazF family toxin [Sphingomonas sp. TF3]
MATFVAGTIVRVPFPYTDRDTRQHRPALVVSHGGLGPDRALLWVAMITSASNRRWADDVAIEGDHATVGLPVASLVRTAKLATIDAAAATPLGTLDAARFAQVRAALAGHLGLAGTG